VTVLAQVLAQLDTELVNFNTIKAAWTSKPLANFDAELPAALVYLAGIESEASPFANATIQPGDYRIAVLTVCAVPDLETRMGEVRTALAGFELSGGLWDPLEHQTGDTVEINESICWWRDVFAARNYQGN
jgi:hypothetical protein